jgi:hypothetical protein
MRDLKMEFELLQEKSGGNPALGATFFSRSSQIDSCRPRDGIRIVAVGQARFASSN